MHGAHVVLFFRKLRLCQQSEQLLAWHQLLLGHAVRRQERESSNKVSSSLQGGASWTYAANRTSFVIDVR